MYTHNDTSLVNVKNKCQSVCLTACKSKIRSALAETENRKEQAPTGHTTLKIHIFSIPRRLTNQNLHPDGSRKSDEKSL